MGVRLVEVALFIPLMQGVVCRTWAVTLPQSIMGLSGSCIIIPCRFDVPETVDKRLTLCSNQSVVWKKERSDGLSVYNGRNLPNQIQGRVVGDVTRKDCTTSFHSFPQNYSDVYFFRLECDEILRFTFREPVNILVKPEASPPKLTPVTQVSEGAQVRLQCSVPVPCSSLPPSITWHLGNNPIHGQSQKQHVTFMAQKDEPMIMTSLLTFKALAEHHNQRVTCNASYPLTTGGSKRSSATTQQLDVQYGPRLTEATLGTPGPLAEGRTVMLTCSSDANPPVDSYTWYRARTGTNLMKIGEGEFLALTVSQGGGGVYLCEAQSRRGSQRSRPVSLPISAASDSNNSMVLGLYIISGTLLLLLILIVVVDVNKYRSFSKRLKQIEQRDEQMYVNLGPTSAASVYDQLEPPKQASQLNDHDYVLPN
ncbi:sialic acid-binding Ig-like lectin 12 [Nelusetta ayraudi]|uniref:sialic acid-binding Ig-like lectin 12 n=1 Tax=Nelusetta ayraudi TaxID=303726 RepID=UPI003F72E723